MSKPEYDVLRIEGSSNRVEVLMKNCDHVTAYDLSSCISDHPGWSVSQRRSLSHNRNPQRREGRVKLTKGTILAHRRKGAGIEQTTLAAALGISASALCKMEKGQREHDWTRFGTAHEMIERLERGEPVPVREEASDE